MNARKIIRIVLLVVAAGFGVYLLVRQNVTSEEAQVRKLIAEVEDHFENQKLKKCLAVVSDDYSDNLGHGSKAELESELRWLFRISSKLRLSLDDVVIQIHGDEADISMTAIAQAQTTFGDLSLNREVGYTRYVLAARKENGRWKVLRVEGMD